MTTSDIRAGRPALFFLRTPQPAGVADFYSATFGWDLKDEEAFTLDGEVVAAATPREGGWFPAFAVDSLEDAAALVERAGGSIHGRRDDARGLQALAADPTGAAFGLWQIGTGAGGHRWGQPGTVVWIEQKTRDQDGATGFMGAVFGCVPVGPTGPGKVRVLTGGEAPPFGGVMQFDDRYAEDHEPFWLLYVEVDDVAAAMERAHAAGGSTWFPVTDTPLGPLAYVRDPAGNAIALVAVSEGGQAMLGRSAGR